MRGMKERLMAFIAHLGMSVRAFEQSCGRPNGFVNNMKDNLSVKTLGEISARYPELDTQWLITGEGTMTRQATDTQRLLGRIAELEETVAALRELNRQQNEVIEAWKGLRGRG
jgi:hypothetical protein